MDNFRIICQPSHHELAEQVHKWILTGKPTCLAFVSEEGGVRRSFEAKLHGIEGGVDGVFTLQVAAKYNDVKGALRLMTFNVEFGIEHDE